MPRNGSGVYSLPAGLPVNGETSDATDDIRTPFSDLEADANTVRPVVAGGTGASSAAAALVNLGLTATAAEINVLDGVTASTAEINVLDGLTPTTTELNYVDGVTSAIQTQLNAKQASDATLTSLAGLSLAQGDILYATAADTLARLPKGTAGQLLAMNAGATAPEWGGGSDLFFRLNSANAGADVTTAQNLLPQSVTLAASTVYEYELVYSLSKTAGAVSHGVSTGFGGTATINNIYRHQSASASTSTAIAALTHNGYQLSATSVLIVPAFASATANIWNRETGTVSINGGGTFIPQYTLSAAPGGAYSTNIGAFFRLRRLGASGANLSSGSWA